MMAQSNVVVVVVALLLGHAKGESWINTVRHEGTDCTSMNVRTSMRYDPANTCMRTTGGGGNMWHVVGTKLSREYYSDNNCASNTNETLMQHGTLADCQTPSYGDGKVAYHLVTAEAAQRYFVTTANGGSVPKCLSQLAKSIAPSKPLARCILDGSTVTVNGFVSLSSKWACCSGAVVKILYAEKHCGGAAKRDSSLLAPKACAKNMVGNSVLGYGCSAANNTDGPMMNTLCAFGVADGGSASTSAATSCKASFRIRVLIATACGILAAAML